MLAALVSPTLNYPPIFPELVLTGTGIIGILYEALAPRPRREAHLMIGLLGLAAAAGFAIALWGWTGAPTVMAGAISVDRFAVVGRLILYGVAAMGLLYGAHYFAWSGDPEKGEFAPLIVFATLGMSLIVSAGDLIVVFIALEILSLSLYV